MRIAYLIICVTFLYSCSTFKGKNLHTDYKDAIQEKRQSEFDSCFIESQKQKVFGNYSQQKLLLEKCLKIKPLEPTILFCLANFYLTTGQESEALFYARQAANYDESNEWFLLQIAGIYQQLGNYDSTIFYYRKLLRLKPHRYDYSFKLAVLYYENGNYNSAVGVLKKLEYENGPSSDLFLLKYKIYLALGKNKECIRALKLACTKFPNESRFYGLLAEHYAALGNDQVALSYYQQLFKVDPENEKGYLSLIEFYRRSNRTHEALQIAKGFVANSNYSTGSKIDVISAFLNDRYNFGLIRPDVKFMVDTLINQDVENLNSRILLANYFLRTNDFKKAKMELGFLVSKSKNSPVVWKQMLFLLNSMNDYKGIIELTDTANFYFKDEPVFYLYRGISFFQYKQYSEAIKVFKAGIELVINEKDLLSKFYSFLGECYNAINKYSESDFAFEKSLYMDPSNVIVLNNYSYYLALRNEKLDLALSYISRCVKVEPRNSTYLDTYAWILFKKGKFKEANKVMKEAELYGGLKNENMLEHYCEILLSLNLRDEALRYYYKIRDSGKENKRLRILLNLTE